METENWSDCADAIGPVALAIFYFQNVDGQKDDWFWLNYYLMRFWLSSANNELKETAVDCHYSTEKKGGLC